MTESLWCGSGCRQGGLGATAVYGTQESSESPWLERGDVKSQVGADRNETTWGGSKVVQELPVNV